MLVDEAHMVLNIIAYERFWIIVRGINRSPVNFPQKRRKGDVTDRCPKQVSTMANL